MIMRPNEVLCYMYMFFRLFCDVQNKTGIPSVWPNNRNLSVSHEWKIKDWPWWGQRKLFQFHLGWEKCKRFHSHCLLITMARVWREREDIWCTNNLSIAIWRSYLDVCYQRQLLFVLHDLISYNYLKKLQEKRCTHFQRGALDTGDFDQKYVDFENHVARPCLFTYLHSQ